MNVNSTRMMAILAATLMSVVHLSGPLLGADCCQCGLCSDKCATCCLECKTEDEERSYYDIECKQVCVPRVVFPWQKNKCCDSCKNNGARVRCVKQLKKKKYDCPVCVYKWTPRMIGGCDCCPSCDGCCEPSGLDQPFEVGSSGEKSANGDSIMGQDMAPAPTPPVPTANWSESTEEPVSAVHVGSLIAPLTR